MIDLRKAAEMALEALERCGSENYVIEREAIAALRQALAQPEQEPVARVDYDRKGNIAWLYGPVEPDGTLLYTAPQNPEWVGLTEVDIYELMDFDNYEDQFDFAHAIEAKLKEKNT